MSIRDDLIAHAATCREALAGGRARPRWRGGYLSGADLRGADLRGVDLRSADLTGAGLRGADLRGANLRGADLTGVDLYGANLTGVDLRGADLTGADLTGAKIREGVVIAIAEGEAGGYRWHALRIAEGVVLQYGCDRATLTEWQTRGPEYGARHRHDATHWAKGPAVAIAAAEALLALLST